jgi:predicted DNA-binding protein (MmcQ/YjbR family)
MTTLQSGQLDSICAAWPGVSTAIKWEVDLVYSVAGKMFAVYCTLGVERGRVSFKVDADRFLELTEQPGFMPAPYMARAFWVTLTDPDQVAPGELERFLRRSYDLVVEKLPLKVQRGLAAAGEAK